jgi:hypothetical protein
MKYNTVAFLAFAMLLGACASQKHTGSSIKSEKYPTQVSFGAHGKIITPKKTSTLTCVGVDTIREIFSQPQTIALNSHDMPFHTKKAELKLQAEIDTYQPTKIKRPAKTFVLPDEVEKEDQLRKKSQWSLWLAISLFTPFIFLFFITLPLALVFSKQAALSTHAHTSKRAKRARTIAIIWLVLAVLVVVALLIFALGPAGGSMISFM